LGFGFGYFAKRFANFELDNLKYQKKFLFFGYGFEYQFKFFSNFKIYTQIHTQKIKIFLVFLII